jgi:hypothetical protein
MPTVPEQSDRTRGLIPFQPGQSGNPTGRPRRKPITDALIAELDKAVRGGGTNAEKAAKHLVSLMFNRDPRVCLEASKLVLAYVEGMPSQSLTIDIRERAKQLAEQTGADPEWLIKRAQEIAAGVTV